MLKNIKKIHTYRKDCSTPDIIVQPMEFASPPLHIPDKENGSVFKGDKKYQSPHL